MTITSRPPDLAKQTYLDALRGDVPVDNAIAVLTKHVGAVQEGKRRAQLEAWIEELESRS